MNKRKLITIVAVVLLVLLSVGNRAVLAASVSIAGLSPADGARVQIGVGAPAGDIELRARVRYSLPQSVHSARIWMYIDGTEVHREDFTIFGSGEFPSSASASVSVGSHTLVASVEVRNALNQRVASDTTSPHTFFAENDPLDDTCGQADTHTFNVGDPIPQGSLELTGDHDWVRITVPGRGGMTVNLDIPSDPHGVDYNLEVWDDSCSTRLDQSTWGPGFDESITLPVTPGAYRVHVYGWRPNDFGTAYQLATSFSPKLTAGDARGGAQFGWPVAIDGDIAVIGMTPGRTLPGAAYIFQRNGRAWNQVKELTASTPTPGDWFGRSVAISGNTVVVGAAFDSGGVAYIFERNEGGTDNWGRVKTLSTSESDDLFGFSVAISGDTAVVGARGDDGTSGDWSADFGAAHIFERNQGGTNNWGWVTKLTAGDAASWDVFGSSIAISGNTVVVGAPGDDDFGAAYIFEKPGTGWPSDKHHDARLTASDAAAQDHFGDFGDTVAISGDTIVVGGFWTGAAYVFKKPSTGWPIEKQEDARLTSRGTEGGGNFGVSVAADGDMIVVGAHTDNPSGGWQAGSAYMFQQVGTRWNQIAKLTAFDAADFDVFGRSVAISGGTIVVGVPGADAGGSNRGAAYVYEGVEPEPPTFNIRAFIEGRSRLHIWMPTSSRPMPASLKWHHIEGVAPGRLGGDQPTLVNYRLWFPRWPDVPDPQNRNCDCLSSSFFEWAWAHWPYIVALEVVEARTGGSVRIIQQPHSPDYTLIVEFDDTGVDGAAWYDVNLFYEELRPTAIDLLSFTAQAGDDRVTLAWETGTEVDNAGFNLWRSEAADGEYARINEALVPAEGDAVSGASYTYDDTGVVEGVTYYYKLEDVDVHGASTFHGPVSATPGRIHLIYLPLVLK